MRHALRSLVLISSLGFGVVLAPLPCFAQPTAEDRESANRLMDKADELFAAKDYKGALELYRQADTIMHVPTTAIEVAKTELELGHLLEAWNAAKMAADYPQKPDEPPPFTHAREQAKDMADKIAARLSTLTIRVEGAPEGAPLELTIDGKHSENNASPQRVNPGKHVVTVTAAGAAPITQTVTSEEGKNLDVVLKLVTSPPPDKSLERVVDDKPSSSGRSPLVYIGFGLGGAGLLAGTITGILSLTTAASAKEECNKLPQGPGDQIRCPPSAQGDIDTSLTLANISNVSIGVGLAGIGLGVVGLLMSNKSEPKDKPSAQVYMTPLAGGGAMGLTGRF